MKVFSRQRIPDSSCAKKETVDIDIPITSRNGDKKIMQSFTITRRAPSRIRKWNQLNWIVFVIWLTDERRLVLFSAGTIVRDPHHRESATHCNQDFNLHTTWVQAYRSDNHYTTAPNSDEHLPQFSELRWTSTKVIFIEKT